jgi:hypothetical protein
MGVCVMLIWLSIALKFHFDNADGSPIAQVHCAALRCTCTCTEWTVLLRCPLLSATV